MDSRELVNPIKADGRIEVGIAGSHHHFKHPFKPGKVTIPHPRKDLALGTMRSILKQTGLLT